MLVKEIMKRPFTVNKNINLSEAARMMSSKGIGSLIFISGDKIKGIVTESDLVKNFSKRGKLSEAMTSKVKTIESTEGIDRAAEFMRENKIKRLPVVEDGKLVGVITLTDVLANFEALEGDFFF